MAELLRQAEEKSRLLRQVGNSSSAAMRGEGQSVDLVTATNLMEQVMRAFKMCR